MNLAFNAFVKLLIPWFGKAGGLFPFLRLHFRVGALSKALSNHMVAELAIPSPIKVEDINVLKL